MSTFTPLGNRVLIKQTDAVSVTKGGIMLPEKAQRKPLEGTVVAVGPGKRLEDGSLVPTVVKVNDYVIMAPQSGNEVMIGGEKYVIVNDDYILGVVE